MRPRIMIPTLIIIVLLFDLDDDMMNIDEDFILSDEEEEWKAYTTGKRRALHDSFPLRLLLYILFEEKKF